MLTLDINEKYLVLSRDQSVTVKWKNPACFLDKLVGDVGVNISLPFAERNRAILGNPEMFERYNASADYRKHHRATLRYGGALLVSGTLTIEGTDNGYECWLQSDLGAMGEAQQEKKITDMDWKTGVIFDDKVSYDDDTDEYGISMIHNPNFWEGKGKEKTVETDYIDENGVEKKKEDTRSFLSEDHRLNYNWNVNPPVTLNPLSEIKSGRVLSPFLHLKYCLRESLRMNGFFIDRNDMIPEISALHFLKNAKIYNNFNILDVVFITQEFFQSTWDYEAQEYVSIPLNELQVLSWEIKPFNYADLLPKIPYKDFLLGIQNTFNYIFRFRHDLYVDIIDRNEILNGESISLEKYHINNWVPGEQKNVTLKFMPEYDKDDGRFDNNFEDLTERRADFGDPVETYDDLLLLEDPAFGELRHVKDVDQVYEYNWQVFVQETAFLQEEQRDWMGWKMVSTGPQPYLYGTGDEIEEIKTMVGPIQQTSSASLAIYHEVKQKGNIATLRSLYNDFSLRYLWGNAILNSQTLFWEGDFGLFAKRWKNWARFWATRCSVSTEFDLPANMIVHVAENITGKFATFEGEFIIEEMETEFSLNKIGTTRIKGYKL